MAYCPTHGVLLTSSRPDPADNEWFDCPRGDRWFFNAEHGTLAPEFRPGTPLDWVVNVLFARTDADQVMNTLDPLVSKHGGSMDVSGLDHQSWSFGTPDQAYAFALEAADEAREARQAVTVITPEVREK